MPNVMPPVKKTSEGFCYERTGFSDLVRVYNDCVLCDKNLSNVRGNLVRANRNTKVAGARIVNCQRELDNQAAILAAKKREIAKEKFKTIMIGAGAGVAGVVVGIVVGFVLAK